MFAQGAIWQALRQDALATFPAGSISSYSAPTSLRSWLARGSFTVVGVSPKRVTIEGAAVDVGSSMVTEAAFFLDHAVEQAIHLRHQFASGRWSSPAWSLVTVYYWAFFNALALTRMLGETAWFLTPDEAHLLEGIAPTASGKVWPGPRIVTCGLPTAAALREVVLHRPAATRIHDIIWRLWFKRLRGIVPKPGTAGSNAPELRLYWPQVRAANALGDSWPSELRNVANYAPGVAYGAARGSAPTSIVSAICVDPSWSDDQAIDRLESDAVGVAARPLVEQLPAASRLLLSTASVLHRIASTLFADLVDRRYIDRRWLTARSRLLSTQYASYNSKDWPIVSAA